MKKNFRLILKNKTLGPKSSVIYDIWGVLPIKVDLHPPGTPTPQKHVLLQQDHVFGGVGVPDGCKSTLISKTPHISYITELFGQWVLFFKMGQKFFHYDFFAILGPTLKTILIYNTILFLKIYGTISLSEKLDEEIIQKYWFFWALSL